MFPRFLGINSLPAGYCSNLYKNKLNITDPPFLARLFRSLDRRCCRLCHRHAKTLM